METRRPTFEPMMPEARGVDPTRLVDRTAGSTHLDLWTLCIRTAAVFSMVWTIPASGWARRSPRETVRARVAGCSISIEYGRPPLLGRDALKLIEPGQLWRLGADAPTTIDSSQALAFGGVRVPRGKHILLVRYIAPGVWSLVVSGAPAIDYAPDARLAEVLMHFEHLQNPVQQLNIHLSRQNKKGAIEIAWGTYRLSAQFVTAR